MKCLDRICVDASQYDKTYFEDGENSGVSGYTNYRWMPELTLPMLRCIVAGLPIKPDETVLDYGCAKGYVTKALRILGVNAWGVDVSSYAIGKVDAEVRPFCHLIEGCGDRSCFAREYNWMIAKDVFEHIMPDEISLLLSNARGWVRKIFVVVPLAQNDHCGKYIIPAYDCDVTHVVAKTAQWWQDLFEDNGWGTEFFNYTFNGCKENWTSRWPNGNGFFILHASQ
jgi:hypothetical protein